jgi:hypothetical protein
MKSMVSCIWWGKIILVGFFFSASFIILMSLVGILYPVFQVHAHFKTDRINHDET